MPQATEQLTERLTVLFEQRAAKRIGAATYAADKRALLLMPPKGVPSVIKWLIAFAALNIGVLAIAVNTAGFSQMMLLGLLILTAIGLRISQVMDRVGMGSDESQLRRIWHWFRRAVYLDLADDVPPRSDTPKDELAALRYLRDTGAVTEREFTAGRAIIEGSFAPNRTFAIVTAALLALNVGLFATSTLISEPAPKKSLAEQLGVHPSPNPTFTSTE
ncbi:hypothetical protein [Yoonia sp. 208BN28-4]|uniref:hypothetical protein n=1 Tax=Yoonia sp. 208BN28-4 TaxID=3126505 RepID=UPI0030ED3F8D